LTISWSYVVQWVRSTRSDLSRTGIQ